MIETYELSKSFDTFLAVENISLKVDPGTVVAILGPNGAGKTTTVRMLTSILQPSSGWAKLGGYDVVKQPAQVRASVGVLTEQHGLYERMTALKYLDFFAKVYNLPPALRQTRARDLMERFGLGKAMDRRVGTFSKGMKQKLALVRSMLHDPPVLLLDEPTSAMDPQSAKQVRDAIADLRRDQRTVMLTTHNLMEAQQLADKIGVIRQGRIIAFGSFDELAEQFVGQALMRLQLSEPKAEALAADLREAVEVREVGEDYLDFHSPHPAQTNPAVLRRALDLGYPVLGLSQRSRSLEEVYLKIVEEDESRVGVTR
jgi:ABC-2 type transport system ATP-binding protein